ncbi:MAG: putative DNA-binding domain-containing protein [Pseudomonadota bacterium]
MGNLRDLQMQFAGHIRNPEEVAAPADVEDRRMQVYRRLFFNNIQNFIGNSFPVLRKLYDRASWRAIMRDFFVRHRAHSPLFPELPREFLKFVEAHRGPEMGDPPFILELVHYEWTELALSLDETELAEIEADREGDPLIDAPVLSPLAWLISYRFPVHQIRADFQPAEAPPEPTHLVVYRRRNDRVKFLKVNAVTARLITLLRKTPDQTGRSYLEQMAQEMSVDPATLEAPGRQIFEDLARRDIVLGTRAAAAT